MQLAACARQRHVARMDIVASAQRLVDDAGQRLQLRAAERFARGLAGHRRVDAEQPHRRGVRRANAAERVHGHHTGGDAIENRFDIVLSRFHVHVLAFELHRRSFQPPAAGGQLAGHAVERVDERAEFVLRLGDDAMVEMAGADFLGGGGEQLNGPRDPFGQIEAHPR